MKSELISIKLFCENNRSEKSAGGSIAVEVDNAFPQEGVPLIKNPTLSALWAAGTVHQ
jgi:hypothetical protein